MADKTLRTTIELYDQVTKPINKMISAMDSLIGVYESAEGELGNAFNPSAIYEARQMIGQATQEMQEFADRTEQAGNSQQTLGNHLGATGQMADMLTDKFKKMFSVMGAIAGVKALFDFGKESLDFANTQNRVETQLQTVLMNQGQTLEAYKTLKETASQIQSQGMYGDEAMLGGAAELATYISDTEAIQSMMGTLSNFAAGMSGGGEVNADQMVQYATQLGKALDGSYDGLTKKGFVLTDQQKEIIDNGTDMEKALVLDEIIGQSWENLYNTMSNTPEGKIISMQNLIGDLREEVGNRLYPVIATIAGTIIKNIDTIRGAMNLLTIGIGVVGKAFNLLLTVAMPVMGAIWDATSSVAGFFVDAFAGAIDGVQVLFYGFASGALEAISWVAEGLSKLPFVEFDYEGLSSKAKEYADKSWDIYNNGSTAGNAVRDFFNFDAWDSTLDWSGYEGQNLASNVADIAESSATSANALSTTVEELKYLNDIAERDAINKFTTAEIKVDMTNNNSISSKLDIDGIVNDLADAVLGAMSSAAEGVYA